MTGTIGAISTAEPIVINTDYTPAWAGLPNFASVEIALAGQGQGGLVPPAAMGWQDPQVYLAAAAADKSSVTHHDIADFVTKDTIDELIVARGVHGWFAASRENRV